MKNVAGIVADRIANAGTAMEKSAAKRHAKAFESVQRTESIVKVTYTRKNLFVWGYGSDLSEAIKEAKQHFTSQGGNLKSFGSEIPDSAYLFVGELPYSELLLAIQMDRLTENSIKQYFLN